MANHYAAHEASIEVDRDLNQVCAALRKLIDEHPMALTDPNQSAYVTLTGGYGGQHHKMNEGFVVRISWTEYYV